MKYVNNKEILKIVVLSAAIFTAPGAIADTVDVMDACSTTTPMVLDAPQFEGKYEKSKGSICVDIVKSFTKAKILFNLDTDSVNGNGDSKGLKHMYMFGVAMMNKMKKMQAMGLPVDPADFSIIGVMHGAAVKWALRTNPEQRFYMNKIFELANYINIQLEICGVNMRSNGLTKGDLYTYDADGNVDIEAPGRIYVNNGAIGRMLDLQNRGYAYFHEGYELH